MGGVAIALGPIVGGWLLEHFSWSSIFVAMGPVAAAGVVLVAVSVPTSKDPAAAPVDMAGLVLSAAAMALLVFTIIEAPDYGWDQRAEPGRVRGLGRPAGRVHRLGAAGRPPDARRATVPQHAVQRG